jgi:hypothetical protein
MTFLSVCATTLIALMIMLFVIADFVNLTTFASTKQSIV